MADLGITSSGIFHVAVRSGEDGRPSEYLPFYNTDWMIDTDGNPAAKAEYELLESWGFGTGDLKRADPPSNWHSIADLPIYAKKDDAMKPLLELIPLYPRKCKFISHKGVSVVGQIRDSGKPIMYAFFVPELESNLRAPTGYMKID
eukprot:jgi/Mesvir1/12682/Mv01681-RA.1